MDPCARTVVGRTACYCSERNRNDGRPYFPFVSLRNKRKTSWTTARWRWHLHTFNNELSFQFPHWHQFCKRNIGKKKLKQSDWISWAFDKDRWRSLLGRVENCSMIWSNGMELQSQISESTPLYVINIIVLRFADQSLTNCHFQTSAEI